jgi:hypothetical protein
MKRTVSWISAAALLVTLGLMGAVACSNQGEGERCDPNNDNEDCASGLTCQKIEGQSSPLCCPPAPQPASVSACIPGQPLQPDASTTSDAATSDAPVDVSEDASQDVADDVTEDVAPDATEDAAQDAPQDVVEAGQDAPADVVEAGQDASDAG